MNKFLSPLIIGAALLTVGCSSEDMPKTPAQGSEIAFICTYASENRASDNSFENNDKIGVFMTVSGDVLQIAGNELNNELFSYNGSNWTSARKVYWNEGNHDIYAYYPYAKDINDIENYQFSIATDQTGHAGIAASDFLWASNKNVQASASPVTLQFAHHMSKVIVMLEKGTDYEGEIPADCQVYIHNTATTASIDLATGGVSKQTYSPTESIHAMKLNNSTFQAIVVPQNIETRRPLVEVVTNGISYLMDGKISLKQGYCHTLVVTLSKNPSQTAIEIGGTISGWD